MKIHLLLKKEEIDTAQMNEDKIAVVLDILLVTSTITACLDAGAKQVIPVLNETEARTEAQNYLDQDVVLVGEYNGITINGFLDPSPTLLRKQVKGKTVVLSTTNGTVAIRKTASAKKVYAASLLNGLAVSKRIAETHNNETIVVVCSGSSNQFCLEDFYGAGHIIAHLVDECGITNVDLTDSALAAKLFYENLVDQSFQTLRDTRVGQMLEKYDLVDDIAFASQKGVLPVIPRLVNGKAITLDKAIEEKL